MAKTNTRQLRTLGQFQFWKASVSFSAFRYRSPIGVLSSWQQKAWSFLGMFRNQCSDNIYQHMGRVFQHSSEWSFIIFTVSPGINISKSVRLESDLLPVKSHWLTLWCLKSGSSAGRKPALLLLELIIRQTVAEVPELECMMCATWRWLSRLNAFQFNSGDPFVRKQSSANYHEKIVIKNRCWLIFGGLFTGLQR